MAALPTQGDPGVPRDHVGPAVMAEAASGVVAQGRQEVTAVMAEAASAVAAQGRQEGKEER